MIWNGPGHARAWLSTPCAAGAAAKRCGRLAAWAGWLLAALASLAGAALAQQPATAILIDLHSSADGVTIVARGQPGMTAQAVSAALSARLAEACPNAETEGPVSLGDYPFLASAADQPVPAGALLFPTKAFHVVRPAPMASQRARCTWPVDPGAASAATPAPTPPSAAAAAAAAATATATATATVRLAVVSHLAESITYVDQGAFRDRRLKVRPAGAAHAQVVADAAVQALAARGVQATLVDAGAPHDLRLAVGPEPVPGEGLIGPVLLTKIGAFGITKLSIAYCSIAVKLQRRRSPGLSLESYVRTFQGMPNVYEHWDREMANGPQNELHARISALTQASLSSLVGASVHAVPPDQLQRLLAR